MSFEKTLRHTLQFEGGYANDPSDRGGETFRGISRKNWPHWGGWDLIDQVKRSGVVKPKDIDVAFRMDAEMERLVAGFYLDNFWEPFALMNLPPRATVKLFDASVNVGIGQAVKFLQRVLNSMANAGLAVDGHAGPATWAAIAKVLPTQENDEKMIRSLAKQQRLHYDKLFEPGRALAAYADNRQGFYDRAAWLPEK